MEQKRRSMRKDKKGFTGLEAAIVLTAFVVVAAVFSYVVLNAGFFTTEKAKEVVHTGVETATSAVTLAGDTIAVEGSTNGTVGTLYIPLKISAGGGSIQIGADSAGSDLIVTYLDESVYSADCTWARTWITQRDTDDILDFGEVVQLNVTIPTNAQLMTASTATDRTFTVEIKPVEGASLGMTKQTPSTIEAVNALY